MVETRPDIVFSIVVAAYFAMNLGHAYIETIKTILKYLKWSIDYSITYRDKRKTLSIEGYPDSD